MKHLCLFAAGRLAGLLLLPILIPVVLWQVLTHGENEYTINTDF